MLCMESCTACQWGIECTNWARTFFFGQVRLQDNSKERSFMWGCGIPFFCQLPTAKHSKGEKKKQASRSSRPPTEKPPNTAESLTAKIISLTDIWLRVLTSLKSKRQMRRCDRNIVKVLLLLLEFQKSSFCKLTKFKHFGNFLIWKN